MITESRDERLDKYLSYDVAVTHMSADYVWASLRQANQEHIYAMDVELAKIGRAMSWRGIAVDVEKRRALANEYETKADELRKEFVEAAAWSPSPGKEPNPASYQQLTRLFYEEFGLPVLGTTDTGAPSTEESVLLELLGKGVDARARATIHALLGWREVDKIQGTYVGREKARSDGQEAKYNPALKLYGGLPMHADGRIRCIWKNPMTSGRWSSSPNMQNIPKKLRTMFIAAPGHVLVASDYSALELRLQVLEAGDKLLTHAFTEFDAGRGPDIHRVNTATIFGTTIDKVTPEARDFGKRYVYAAQYGASDERIFQTLSLLRDDDFKPVFPQLQNVGQITVVTQAWWKAHPEIIRWRKNVIAFWRQHGYLEEQGHFRRRYFVGGEKHEEMWSHRIQGRGAAMMNNALLSFAPACDGLVINGHDQMVVECPEDLADKVAALQKNCMEMTVGPMRFPVEPKIAHNWKEAS